MPEGRCARAGLRDWTVLGRGQQVNSGEGGWGGAPTGCEAA